MIITKATDWQEARLFYHAVIDAMQGANYHPMWQKDIYPSSEEIQTAVKAGTMYLGMADGEIACAMVLNQSCNPEYEDTHWSMDLTHDEFMVIHMLCVHPRFSGQGYAKELVRFALETAKAEGMKAVRLDVLKGNLPAEKLYPSCGFQYVDTIKMFYEDTGWMSFELFEYDFEGE